MKINLEGLEEADLLPDAVLRIRIREVHYRTNDRELTVEAVVITTESDPLSQLRAAIQDGTNGRFEGLNWPAVLATLGLAINDRLDSIDDALRNTVGGHPRY